jgi:hypothetical protein
MTRISGLGVVDAAAISADVGGRRERNICVWSSGDALRTNTLLAADAVDGSVLLF